MRGFRLCIVAFLGWLITAGSATALTLKAGVARVDITPPLGEKMWGYAGRKAPAQGTWDPLYARILVLEMGDKRMALVDLDLGRTLGPASIQRIRDQASRSSGVLYVLIAAIHTHSGPVIEDFHSDGIPDWEATAVTRIGQAIHAAQESVVEARLGTGYGVAYIGHNRLRDEPNGSVTWFQTNSTMVSTAPVDPTVSVLRIDAASGKPLAILVNYACHPVVFGPDNLKYSADFAGVTVKTVETAFDGVPLCMFMQGGDGDINPYYAVTPLEQDAVQRRNWTGETLGREAVRVARSIETHPEPNASLDIAEDWLSLKPRWDLEKYRMYLLKSNNAQAAENYTRKMTSPKLPVATILINKRIAIMTMPGEPFVDFQQEWRRRSPVPDAFFFAYANAHYDYFPTIRQAALGGYGAASSSTQIEPDAGAIMLNHAVVKVYEMLGRLTDTPEDLQNKH
jgi:hypothetical protein